MQSGLIILFEGTISLALPLAFAVRELALLNRQRPPAPPPPAPPLPAPPPAPLLDAGQQKAKARVLEPA